MTLRRTNQKSVEETESLKVDASLYEASPIDSSELAESDNLSSMAELANAVANELNQRHIDESMSGISDDDYKSGGIKVTAPVDKKAYKGALTPRDRDDLIKRLQTRSATAEDMGKIDESMILDLPFIKAADFSIPGQYSPVPRDPAIRFRWVNCVNALQSNMQRFLALGFKVAEREDVNEDKTPLADSMISGSQIKQYDVVLMKINVLELMSLYKKNVLDSLFKLDSIQKGGLAAAGQTFSDLVNNDPTARSQYASATYKKGGQSPVSFSQS